MNEKTVEYWNDEIDEFARRTKAFSEGEVSKGEYKGFSGKFGSYAQRESGVNMLRLRLPCGSVPMDKMRFIVEIIRKYNVNMIHFTTCQTIQLHNLNPNCVADIIRDCLNNGIVTLGGGGDYPRNVMCTPLSGVQNGECFDVKPWADAASDYLLTCINAEKMPRKLKVSFSNSKANVTHTTFRDLGFAANDDGTFDVYSAGGLGTNPKFGVKMAEGVAPEKIIYYIKAMRLTFLAHGNYKSRVKARTRYMQESLGGVEEYKAAFDEKLAEVFNGGEDLTIKVKPVEITKCGDGTEISDRRVIMQKQKGLYAVEWHPIGGKPNVDTFCNLYEVIKDMDCAELRLSPDETVYIINLTAQEAKKVLAATDDGARNEFETSISCIGASVCQIGMRDSQGLLRDCIERVREANLPDNALPKIHISGCPSSCGTHQVGVIGFRGATKVIDKVPNPAFVLFVGGNDERGSEKMGGEIGTILQNSIPDFLIKLGSTVAESGLGFNEWFKNHSEEVTKIAQEFLV